MLNLNVVFIKKEVGEASYGSHGAGVNLELDSSLRRLLRFKL